MAHLACAPWRRRHGPLPVGRVGNLQLAPVQGKGNSNDKSKGKKGSDTPPPPLPTKGKGKQKGKALGKANGNDKRKVSHRGRRSGEREIERALIREGVVEEMRGVFAEQGLAHDDDSCNRSATHSSSIVTPSTRRNLDTTEVPTKICRAGP